MVSISVRSQRLFYNRLVAHYLSVVWSLEVVRISEVENVLVKSIGGTWFVCCIEVVCMVARPYPRDSSKTSGLIKFLVLNDTSTHHRSQLKVCFSLSNFQGGSGEARPC